MRSLGAVLFIVDTTIWLPLCMYIPAITFSQVTGTGIYVITPIVCIVCTFYTCVGGLKAVIWSDVTQSFVMFGSILAVCIKGTYDVGGLPVVLQRNKESGRLNAPEWTWDPTVRLSMLSVIVGGTLHKLQSSDVNQISIQRFLSLPSYEDAKRCMLFFTLLLIFLLSCCSYMGLVAYAVYHDCDPISTKLATAGDQLPSLLMMRTLGSLPGLPGLFVAGVFSAALSSLSTGLNSLACVLLQDIMQPLLRQPLTERQTAFWLRAIVVGFGFSCIGLVNIVEKLGNVVPLATTTAAVSMGPLLGIYSMGVALPWVKGKSVMVGSLVSFLALAWICVNAQLGQMRGEIRHPKMPVSVEGCDYTFDNETVFRAIHDYSPSARNLYHLSFFWYTAMGGVLCMAVSLLASLFFGWENLSQMDPALITPCMRRFLPNKNYQNYFERRFDRRIRIFGSCLFVVMNILWQPICIYVPALTLNQVSGISVAKIVPMTSMVCILYTSVGGIKGVVWTDVIQGFVMIGSMAFVIVKGTLDLGGLNVVLDRNRQFERLVGPDMTLDPTVRMGVLALFIGGAFFKLQANGINQSIVQRYLTLPNFRAVKQAIFLSLTGFMIVLLMCVYIGMLAFAEFYHCDPITTGLARAKDQVIPLYVMKSVGTFPGLVGLFVAGVFSAALSSLSTALNSLSGVILTDFVEPFRKKPLTERQTAYVLRGVVVAFGLLSMASVPIVEKLGLVMQLSSTVAAITCGPLLGAFSVGMLLPFVKTESLLTGISCASTFTAYIVVRAQIAIFTGQMSSPTKPVSVEDCNYLFDLPDNWNATTPAITAEAKSFSIHEISFLWYTTVGSVGTLVGSLLATLYFGRQDPRLVDKELVSPVLRNFWYGQYESVASDEKRDLALHESVTQPKLELPEKS